MGYLWRVLTTIQVSLLIYPQFFWEEDGADLNLIVDQIEDDLQICTALLGLPYIRPDMSREGVILMEYSYTHFIKRYIEEVRHAYVDNFNYIYL